MEMASSVIFEERVEIPYFRSLAEFRVWALSDDFPQRGRIDYIGGRIEVDMSPENLFFHGSVKTEIVRVLANIVRSAGGGYLFSDRTRVSSPAADLSAEPDVVYLSAETIDSGRVRLVPAAGGELDSFVELEGAPDLVVEIVSDSSVAKDTRRLPAAYWGAGIAEYWLIDVRGERLLFRIHAHGADGYGPAPVDADGFQLSAVFARRFRLERRRDARGRWVFDLQSRPCEG
jgi:Uma2 family endonuclease